jgi:voltage-gated potassium channel
MTANNSSLRKRTAQLLEAHLNPHGLGHVIDLFLITLILANVLAVILFTVPSMATGYRQAFFWFEIFSVVVFTIEYLLRLWSCVEESGADKAGQSKTRLRWMLSPLGLIDLLAILPFYVFLFIPDSELSLLMLRIFRGLRLLRIFKLTRYSTALDILFAVLKRESRVLAIVGFILTMILVLASWGIYLLERSIQPDVFSSVPAAMWWAVVTLTTVGYGDVVPLSDGGKIFAGMISLIGIAMTALPAGILAAGFSSEVQRRNKTYSRAANMAFEDGSISERDSIELESLREELGLSKEEASNSMLDARRKGPIQTACPHCGKTL